MNLPTALLVPIALMLQPADGVGASQGFVAPAFGDGPQISDPQPVRHSPSTSTGNQGFQPVWSYRFVPHGFQPDGAYQVRIEQRMTVRVSPRPVPVRPNGFDALPEEPIGPRFIERKIGECVPVKGIAGVQANGGRNLILFMRDRRIVSADLERSCRARDFYSGFYLSGSEDGRLCVDRDSLQSRSGANCKLKRIRQLVEVHD